jgi:hypothetical protein
VPAGALPSNGTKCRFVYSGREFGGEVIDREIVIDGLEGRHTSFSAASRAVTGTSRNGWNDWFIYEEGEGWVLADDWRNNLS